MKRISKIIIFALVCVSILSLSALAVNFPDVPRDGSERANAIYKLADNGIVGGYEDGNFRPNNYLTRAELCKIVNLIFGYNQKDVEGFKDVKTSDWFYDYVLIAKKAGYIKGFEDNTFRGNSNLTREQTCIIISRTAGLYDLPTTTVVKDKISDWAKSDVMKVIANFVMSPDSNGNFRATENITRAELAMALDAFVVAKPVEPSTPATPSAPSVPSIPAGPTTPDVTYYTVKFYDGDGVVISTQRIESGKSAGTPAHTPTKAEDDEYTYTFDCWDKGYTKVTSNLDVYPKFNKTEKIYTVTLNYGSGTTGQSVTEIKVKFNDKLADLLPVSGFTNGTKYFAGWYAGSELIDDEKYSDVKPLALEAMWVSTFTVKFYDGDGTEMKRETVKYEKAATAPTTKPTKATDNEYSYTFKEWDKAFNKVTQNLDVYPVFDKTVRYYTVTLSYGSGTSGNKPSSVKMTYNQSFAEVLPASGFSNGNKLFAGWYYKNELIDTEKYSDIKPSSLTAKWNDKTFTVKFYDAKGNLIKTQSVNDGESATAPSAPTKTATDRIVYTFKGWSVDFTNVKSDLNVYPEYSESDRIYVITLDYGNGQKGSIEVTFDTLLKGALPNSGFENAGKKFAGWYYGNELIDTEVYSDIKPANLVAKWVDNTFTVVFYDASNKIIKTETVKEGASATAPSAPAKASDNYYVYTFKGWNTSFTNVTSNLNVYPTYNKTDRLYSVTLDFGNGTTKAVNVTYDQALSTVLPTSGFENTGKTFAGWYVGSKLVGSEKYSDLTPSTIVAKWTDNTFTVTFYDANGGVLKTQEVKSGKSATAPSNPKKASDNEYTYTFSKWDKSYTNVTQNLDIYPIFTSSVRYYTVYLDYGDDVEDVNVTSIKVTYYESLSDKLPEDGFKCFDMLFDGWYAGNTRINNQCYADLKTTTLTAKWKIDQDVVEDNKEVRAELQDVLEEMKEPLADGFTRTQEWVLKPVVDAIKATLTTSADDKVRISKQYILDNYMDYVSLASYRMNHPYEYENNKLTDVEKEAFTEKFKNDFIFALANNLTSYTVDYLLDFFDIDKNDYIK